MHRIAVTDAKPTCQRRFSGAEISWAAKSDRSYEYIITKGDRVVKSEFAKIIH